MTLSNISKNAEWSTSFPSYNPRDAMLNIRRLMAGEEQEPVLPWWRGFMGTIKKAGDHKYDVTLKQRRLYTKLDNS